MEMRRAFWLVLSVNFIAVAAAMAIYYFTGKNHFNESGFITILSFLQLLLVSWLSYKVYKERENKRTRPFWRSAAFIWAIIAFGFLFLAADEMFRIHEFLDDLIHLIFSMQETGWTDRIDDLLIGIYGLIGVAVLWYYRDEVKSYRETFPFFTTGFILLFLMVGLDALTNRDDVLMATFEKDMASFLFVWLGLTEDALKVFAEAFFVLFFYAILCRARSMNQDSNTAS